MMLLTRSFLAFILTNTVAASGDVCSVVTIEKSIFKSNQRLAGFQYYLLTDVPDIFQCARECFFRRRCLSFNYFENTSLCELNNARIDAPYVILNATVDCIYSDIKDWDKAIGLGPCSRQPCGICEACYPTESSYICVQEEVTSCLDIKICKNNSVDSHYLVRPMSGTKTWLKVYCHEMSSKYPKDFLTLIKENFCKYPPIDYQSCSKLDWVRRSPGVIYYNKIRLDLTVLRVITTDKTFTRRSCDPKLFGIVDLLSFAKSGRSCDANLDYGSAGDCMATVCRPRQGVFLIDLQGTGLAVSPSVQWELAGYLPIMSSLDRSPTNEVIQGVCGGNCGSCKQKGFLLLEPKP